MLNLREISMAKSKKKRGEDISVGDIVILKNESTLRNFWKLAKIEELLPGVDGEVRAAIVKVASNNRRPLLLKRSVLHLIPIEVKANTVSDINIAPECDNTRPRRAAAVAGELQQRERTQYSRT